MTTRTCAVCRTLLPETPEEVIAQTKSLRYEFYICKNPACGRTTRVVTDGEGLEDVAVLPSKADQQAWGEHPVIKHATSANDALTIMDRIEYQASALLRATVKPTEILVSQAVYDVLLAAMRGTAQTEINSLRDQETVDAEGDVFMAGSLTSMDVRGVGVLPITVSDEQDVAKHGGVMVVGRQIGARARFN